MEKLTLSFIEQTGVLFQALILPVLQKNLSGYTRIINSFILEGKQSRIRASAIQLKKNTGLAIPNITVHYHTVALEHLLQL